MQIIGQQITKPVRSYVVMVFLCLECFAEVKYLHRLWSIKRRETVCLFSGLVYLESGQFQLTTPDVTSVGIKFEVFESPTLVTNCLKQKANSALFKAFIFGKT